ncbi:MAG TPA: YbaB/EbfC family nucleoid-associated protein [Azospirillaceae bacterium]|nr:YbaB/EbfC family nucleoid-associated protein [Azospirillaceae bacterium]
MKNLGQMMKQAQQMQAKMQEMQDKLGEVEVTGQAGAGMVQITLNGKGDMKKVKLDKSVVDPEDVEVIEDLILAAFNDAKAKVEQVAAEETSKVMGGLKLPPGLKLPF